MSMRLAPIALLILAAAAPAADRRRVPEATPTGPAVGCVQLNQIRETKVRDDRTIDFVLRGGRVYRNVLPRSCPNLGVEQRFGYATSLNQLCSVDIITVLQLPPSPTGASCGLGRFQPVELAKR
jgi:hypothetical protein